MGQFEFVLAAFGAMNPGCSTAQAQGYLHNELDLPGECEWMPLA